MDDTGDHDDVNKELQRGAAADGAVFAKPKRIWDVDNECEGNDGIGGLRIEWDAHD